MIAPVDHTVLGLTPEGWDLALKIVQVLVIPALIWAGVQWRRLTGKQAAIGAKQADLGAALAAHVARCEACAKATTRLNDTVDVLHGEMDDSREQVAKALAAGETRMATIEVKLEQLPNAAEVHNLALTVERLGGDLRAAEKTVEGLRGVVERLERVLNRQEDFLLNGGTGK